jgi:alpha-galactosidase
MVDRSRGIAGPRRIGLRPGRLLVQRIGVPTGRDGDVHVSGLPPGLTFDRATGAIRGSTRAVGWHRIAVDGEDAGGRWRDQLELVVGDDICLTPPMGWNSWNAFGIAIDEAEVRRQALALLDTGLADVGWTTVNVDDGWQGERDRRGRLQPNAKFGDLGRLCDDLHALGLRVGIYSSPGPTTCGGMPGSAGHEAEDARAFADWGFDYLKYDWCSAGPLDDGTPVEVIAAPYARMRDALDRVGRDIIYHVCEYGFGAVWSWARERVGANAWRTTGDIEDDWESVDRIGFGQADLARFAGPGGWNDPDMLVVGRVGGGWYQPIHDTHLTPDEQRSHLGLWALLAAPLLLGCDITTLDSATLEMLGNREALAINQDPLGRQARRIASFGTTEVWRKDLADGSAAIGMFDRGQGGTIGFAWRELHLARPTAVRDIWSRRHLDADDGLQVWLPPHGSILLRLEPGTARAVAPD